MMIQGQTPKEFIKQFFSYLIVGGIATLVEWSIFGLLFYILHVYNLIAVTIAYIISTFVNMILGRKMTFTNAKINRRLEVFLIYLVSAIGLGANLLLMFIFVDKLHLNGMFSKIMCTGIVFIWNYAVRKWGIYRKTA